MTKDELDDAVAFLNEGIDHARRTVSELALFVSASQEVIAKLVARVEELERMLAEAGECEDCRRESIQRTQDE